MASEEPLFDPSLKKKKKKKVVAFNEDPLAADLDPTTPAVPADLATNGSAADLGPATVHEQTKQNGHVNGGGDITKDEEDLSTMFGDLKKKKKKKDLSAADLADDTSSPVPVQNGDNPSVTEDLNFADLKKKKKSTKKKAAADLEAFERELGEATTKDADEDGDDEEGDFDDDDLGEDPFARGGDVDVGIDTGSEPWLGSDRDYTYPELLHRFYSSLHASNPAMLTASGKRYTIPPPSIMRDGNKKIIFANIAEICKRMHRQPDHVIQFLFSEMGTTGSVDGLGRLVVKGRFQQKQIENILRRYIVEYVTCKTCKSPDTVLSKENRIFFTTCESCGSRRSVNTIKSGFQAQVGRRSKLKN